ncbi:UDP-N-acetylglucosamine 2-epimerase [uncultured Tyzzerella sp.]|uniref:UDP-N-acetylglucosamine 2-epimerase n=1 Tax=uncultured Tyzzerella sp. TaxID=2321398 RepID=UPI0029439F25|nr:UDP-N-acetylglucosamine 2-epimerase [uncultured Tyzzerella sp.]
MKKICIVTGSRAEYGLLKPIIKGIKDDKDFILQIVVTGSHLSTEFGLTYKTIEDDGFIIDEKVEMLLSSDTKIGINKSIGLSIISFGEVFERLKPDLIVVLGDRYEIFAVCICAMVCNIKIAHLHGGEITEGAIDDSIRHCITKMSHIHFTSTEEYKNRVIQLGEQPETVFNVGAIGTENIKKLNLLNKEQLEKRINFKIKNNTVILTFHPVTLENKSSKEQFKNILDAIDSIKDINVIFTKANADTDGRIINNMIDEYVSKNKNTIAFDTMGQLNYFSALQFVDAVVGNSSSGIIEVPTFKIPTVNIGNRQKGRICSHSVINCDYEKNNIEMSIKKALSKSFKEEIKRYNNPYEKDNTCKNIIYYIKQFLKNNNDNMKKFYDIKF